MKRHRDVILLLAGPTVTAALVQCSKVFDSAMTIFRRAGVALTFVSALALLILALPVGAQTRYGNLVNAKFATISSGPQSAMILNVSAGASDSETRAAALQTMQAEWQAKAQGLSRQRAAAEQAGLIKRNALLPFSSLLITRKGGRLVMPRTRPRGRAVGGGALTFRYTGFNATDVQLLQAFVADAYPRIEAVYGAPAVSGEVEVVNAGNLETTTISEVQRFSYGVYDVSNNRILLPIFNDPRGSLQALLLNMIHAFHGPAVFQYDAWEQGFARAAGAVVLRDFARDPELIQKYNFDDPSANTLYSLLRFYDLLNQPALSNATFFPPSQADIPINGKFSVAKMLWARIGMSGAAWLKVYIENQSFFRDFNAAYYAQFDPNANPSLAGNVPALRSLAAPLLPNGVEEVAWNDWFTRQYVLDSSIAPGTKLFAFIIPGLRDSEGKQTSSVTVVYYRTERSGDETLLNDRCYATYLDSTNARLILGSGSEQAAITDGEGGFTIVTTNNVGSDATRMTLEYAAGDQTARTYMPLGFDGDFQAVLLLNLSAKTANVTHTTVSPVTTVVKTGNKVEGSAFAASRATTETDLGVTVVEVSDGGNVRRWKMNTGQGAYYAVLRDGTKGGGIITLTKTFEAGNPPHLASLPLRPLSNDPAIALGLPGSDFLLSYWNGQRSAYETFVAGQPSVAPLQPGRGYWLKITPQDNAGSKKVTVTGTPPETDTDFATACTFGWNLVGSPFDNAINLDDVRVQYLQNADVDWQTAVEKNYVAATLFAFDRTTGQYTAVNAFSGGNWQGYWLRVLIPGGVTLFLPGPDVTRSRALIPTRGQSKSATKPDWKIRLRATQNSAAATVEFGGASGASRAFDNRFDREQPPAIVPGIALEFPHADWGKTAGGRYVSDYRDSRSIAAETWDVAVTAVSEGQVTLSWDGVGTAPRRTTLTLTDAVTGLKIALGSRSSYQFTAKAGETRSFRIAADVAPTLPLSILNLTAVVTRAAGVSGVNFQYVVTRAATVGIEVSTLSGRIMRRMSGGRATAAGQQRLFWDGRAEGNAPLPPGPYAVTVIARDETGASVQTRRIITLLQ